MANQSNKDEMFLVFKDLIDKKLMNSKSFSLGTVSPTHVYGELPQIIFDGETVPSEKRYNHLSSYLPQANDRVLLCNISKTHVVLGEIGSYSNGGGGTSSGANGELYIYDFGAKGDGVTSDQTAVVNAVAEAFNTGKSLNWGVGTFLTTATIPNLHKVKHVGHGVVKRGTNNFYVNPTGTQRNKIHVNDSAGAITNDGLTPNSGSVVSSIQSAFDILANYAPILTGYWEIVLSSGTHAQRATLKDGLLSENPIELTGTDVGGHPNIPTTVISEGLGASALGIQISGGSRVLAKNIKFSGFNGSVSSCGLSGANGTEIYTENCHFENCYYGASSVQRSKLDMKGGLVNSCGYLSDSTGGGAGVRSLMLNHHSIGTQNAGDNSVSPVFTNCYTAILAQESSTGHVDWCTIDNCNYGVVLRINSRANVDGTLFKRNGVAIRVEANANTFISSNVVFATGVDVNGNNVVKTSGGSVSSQRFIDGIELQYATNDSSFTTQSPLQTINTTFNTTFHTAILKAPLWDVEPTPTSPMKKLYFRIFGKMNGTNGNKRINVRLGSGLLGVLYGATEQGVFSADGYIYFNGRNSQYMFMSSERHLGASTRKSSTKATNVMTSDINLTLEAQVDSSLDSVEIDVFEVGMSG